MIVGELNERLNASSKCLVYMCHRCLLHSMKLQSLSLPLPIQNSDVVFILGIFTGKAHIHDYYIDSIGVFWGKLFQEH